MCKQVREQGSGVEGKRADSTHGLHLSGEVPSRTTHSMGNAGRRAGEVIGQGCSRGAVSTEGDRTKWKWHALCTYSWERALGTQ